MSDDVVAKLNKSIEKLKLQSWANDINGVTNEELKKMIVEFDGNVYTIEKEKAEDAELAGLKEQIKALSAGYREATQVQLTKSRYCLNLLESRGVDLDNTEEK